MMTDDLGIAERLARKMGRPARTRSVATRFTDGEELELLRAAEREGKTLREWTREALLKEARRPEDDPIFTEVIAIRLLLNRVLKPSEDGHAMTTEAFQKLVDEVRTGKRSVARDVMQQYLGAQKS